MCLVRFVFVLLDFVHFSFCFSILPLEGVSRRGRSETASLLSSPAKSPQRSCYLAQLGAFDLRVRLTGREVAPLYPWVVDRAKQAKSAVQAHSAS